MLNTMGLSIVGASYLWQSATVAGVRRIGTVRARRPAAIAMVTPLVRRAPWLAPLPDPLEAYLRPAGPYSAFPLFPWAGFLFAGVARRRSDRRRRADASTPGRGCSSGLAVRRGRGVWLGLARVVSTGALPDRQLLARFADVLLHPARAGDADSCRSAWVVEQLRAGRALLQPLVTLGRSSLFVYWIHIEMVYGVIAEPLKAAAAAVGVACRARLLMTLFLYALVLLKNRGWRRCGAIELRGAVLRAARARSCELTPRR